MILRFREDGTNGVHTTVTVFSGHTTMSESEGRDTLGNSGQLTLDTDVWEAFAAALPTFIASRAKGIVRLERSEG